MVHDHRRLKKRHTTTDDPNHNPDRKPTHKKKYFTEDQSFRSKPQHKIQSKNCTPKKMKVLYETPV